MLIGRLSIRLFTCVVYLLTSLHLSSQHTFDILPDVGGINGQSQAWTLLNDSNNFYVIGDLLDTLNDGTSITLPWVSSFNYIGELEYIRVIYDEPLERPFRVARNTIFKNKRNNLLIYGSQRFSENSTHPKLIEIDPETGEILKSTYINHPIDSSKSLTRSLMVVTDTSIILSSYYWINNQYHLYLVFLDENFKFKNSFILQDSEFNNVVYYMEVDSNNTVTLIGDSRNKLDQGNFPEVKPFISRVTSEGNVLYSKTVSGISDKTLTFPISYASTVAKDNSNNWIISCVSVVETHLCKTCNYLLPYTLSLSPEFDSINWIVNFPNLSPENNSQPIVSSITKCTDNSGFLTAGFDTHSFVYKVNNMGEKMWSREYIPLSWNPERALWTELVDMKSTNYNSYILGGRVSDNEANVIRSWLIEIDSLGCIIEGCDSTVSIPLDNKVFSEYFSIFPNPATDDLYILNKHLQYAQCKLVVCNGLGQIINQVDFSSNIGEQYILSLDSIPTGVYYVVILDNSGKSLSLKQILKK